MSSGRHGQGHDHFQPMGAIFNGSNGLEYTGGSPVTGYPFTFSAWVKDATDTGNNNPVLGSYLKGTSPRTFARLIWGNSLPSDPVSLSIRKKGDFREAQGGSASVDGTWHHVLGIAVNDSPSVSAYLNDSVIAESSAANSIPDLSGLDAVGIGYRDTLGESFVTAGCTIAECAMWGRVLTSEEITSLAGGLRPSNIASGRLAYWPLLSNGTDSDGTYHMSAVGTAPTFDSEDHPTMNNGSGGGSIVTIDRTFPRGVLRGVA